MYLPSPHNPLVPANWRWERARWLREGRRHVTAEDDVFTRTCRLFQLEQRAARSGAAQERLARHYPGLYWAWWIHTNAQMRPRWMIEAYLLARQAPAQVARIVKTTPEVVVWYEKLFFNVRPYLGHDGYIINVVLREAVHHGIRENDYDLFWKMVGYAMGPEALGSMIAPLKRLPVRAADQVDNAFAAQIDAQSSKKMFIAARTVPVFDNQQVIFEAYNKAREIDKASGGSLQGEALILQNLQAALTGMPLRIGGPTLAGAPGRPYDEGGAELRASEQVAAALSGQEPAAPDLTIWHYPEPGGTTPDAAPDAPAP